MCPFKSSWGECVHQSYLIWTTLYISFRLAFYVEQSWCALLKMKHVKNTADAMIQNAAQVFGLWYMEDFMGLVGLENIYSLNLTFVLCCWLGMSQNVLVTEVWQLSNRYCEWFSVKWLF